MRKLLALLACLLTFPAAAADNYTATAGAGLTFGAKDAAGVLYSRFIGCDNTTVSQCWAVDASGRLTVNINGTVAVTQSGTWTVQPGNTANTTAWLVTGTGGTFPSTQSGTWTVQPGNTANTTPWLVNVNNTLTAVTPGDGITTTIYGTAPASPVIGVPLLWNGTTYDRQKSAGATGVAAVRPTDGTRNAIIDPCEANLQTYAPISITTATTTRIVAPSASNKTYICMLFLTSAAADNVGIVEGTGGTCGTGTAGVVGGTTAANGPNFAANGGMLLQAGGKVAAAQTAGTNVDLCLITSAATPLAGGIKYVQAP